MKAVNLIPADARRRAGGSVGGTRGPAVALIGALAVALVLVTIYVLTGNTISERKAKVTSLRAQAAQASVVAARLNAYAEFEQLAQTRVDTVRQIASTRFDWRAALSDLSKVVPAGTSLQSLVGTVAPGANASGGGTGTSGDLRGAISAPAFEIAGCTKTQDDVARLMSRLRLINGVTRVTLSSSTKPGTSQSGSSVSASSAAGSGGNCGANSPSFDLVAFFQPLPGAGAAGATAPATPSAGGTPTPGAGGTTTPSSGGTTTPGASK